MSSLETVDWKCAICNKTHKYRIVASVYTLGGGPDLDTRPAQMYRNTMPLWIHECPECGYVASDISEHSGVTKDWLKSKEYLSCDGISFRSYLAKLFYKSYMINIYDGKPEQAFSAILYAAWACDDEGEKANAKIYR